MSKVKIGYHGTTLQNAKKLESLDYAYDKERNGRWLGPGLYFFEDCPDLAIGYATDAAEKGQTQAGMLRAEIDTTLCLDLTRAKGQQLVREAHAYLQKKWTERERESHRQQAFSLHESGMVRAGYHGEFRGGYNKLDYTVIDEAVRLAKALYNIEYQCVRGIFIERGPLYPSSWLFEGVHTAIAVRHPYTCIMKSLAFPID